MGNCDSGKEKDPERKSSLKVDWAPKNNDPVKTVFLGSIGVGKSRTVMHLSGRIDQFDDNSTPATGTNVLSRLDLPGHGITPMSIWDTAGEERYFCVSKNYIREGQAILFLYNIASKETFESLKEFWIKNA
jgi:GTPase SAR1 family protein